ncbi:hypothetical protein DsansV1_C21g0168781 [Dioscorea sansibarensis]
MMSISYFFSKSRSITRPTEVDVVTQGGGPLIIVERGASNCRAIQIIQHSIHNIVTLKNTADFRG